MKFRPLYLYIMITLLSVTNLIIVASKNKEEQSNVSSELNQKMPDDDMHKNLMKHSGNQARKMYQKNTVKR